MIRGAVVGDLKWHGALPFVAARHTTVGFVLCLVDAQCVIVVCAYQLVLGALLLVGGWGLIDGLSRTPPPASHINGTCTKRMAGGTSSRVRASNTCPGVVDGTRVLACAQLVYPASLVKTTSVLFL